MVLISGGTPGIVTIPAGNLLVAWQSDAPVNVPSYSLGQLGDGFYLDASFGSLPGQRLGRDRLR